MAIGQIFGMFDKLDDIVYEPVKLLCDALRQPLKQMDHKNELEIKRVEADIEQIKKDRDMQRTIEQRRLEIELNEMVLNSDLARREKMIQLEAKYREEMARIATEIEGIIVNMTKTSRDEIMSLYEKHKLNYIEIQQAYTDAVYTNVSKMKELFPGNASQEPIIQYMMKYIEQITQESINFGNMLDEDMKSVLGNLTTISIETSKLAGRYLAPPSSETPALTENIVNEAIEHKQ